jgi:hypothetical protein
MPDVDPILRRRQLEERRLAAPQAMQQLQSRQAMTREQLESLLLSLGQRKPGPAAPAEGGDIGNFLITMMRGGVGVPYGMGPNDPQYQSKLMGLSGGPFGATGARYGNVGPGFVPGTSNAAAGQAAARALRAMSTPEGEGPPAGFQRGPRGDYIRTPPPGGGSQPAAPAPSNSAAQAGPPPTVGGPATTAAMARLSTPPPQSGFNREAV